MSFFKTIRGEVKHAALWGALVVATLCVALGGVAFMVAAFFMWLLRSLPPSGAAAVTGGVILLLAFLIGTIGSLVLRKIRKPAPDLLGGLAGGLGLASRLVGILVRKDPRKALILSLVAGVLAEYVMSEKKEK